MRGQTLLGSRKVGWGERPITAAPALRRAADALFLGMRTGAAVRATPSGRPQCSDLQ